MRWSAKARRARRRPLTMGPLALGAELVCMANFRMRMRGFMRLHEASAWRWERWKCLRRLDRTLMFAFALPLACGARLV